MSGDNIWSLLDIDPTNNVKAIKKAYASVLKKYHPEDEPEKFTLLYDAYKSAMNYAKDMPDESFDNIQPSENQHAENEFDFSKIEEPLTEKDKSHSIKQEAFNFDKPLDQNDIQNKKKKDTTQDEAISFEELIDQGNRQAQAEMGENIRQVLKDMRKLYKFGTLHLKQRRWTEYLSSDSFLKVQYLPEFVEQLIIFLQSNKKLHVSVWSIIFHAYFVNQNNFIEYKPEYSALYDFLYRDGNDGGYIRYREWYKKGARLNISIACFIVWMALAGLPVLTGIVFRYTQGLPFAILAALSVIGCLSLSIAFNNILLKNIARAIYYLFIFLIISLIMFLSSAYLFNSSLDTGFHKFLSSNIVTEWIFFYALPTCFLTLAYNAIKNLSGSSAKPSSNN